MPLGAYGTGLLVESHEGRPTKIEGNPQHPSSLGGTDVFNQASVLTMYDPDRSQTNTYRWEMRTWPEVLSSLRAPIQAEKAKGGAGLRVLSGATSSPSFVAQMQELLKTYPQAKWYQWEAVNRDNVYAGAQMAFGQPVETHLRPREGEGSALARRRFSLVGLSRIPQIHPRSFRSGGVLN